MINGEKAAVFTDLLDQTIPPLYSSNYALDRWEATNTYGRSTRVKAGQREPSIRSSQLTFHGFHTKMRNLRITLRMGYIIVAFIYSISVARCVPPSSRYMETGRPQRERSPGNAGNT